MAAIDIAGFVADLKDHAVDHGFHVHDERHFVETYSLRQAWEVDLHPEEACGGPLDLHLSLEIDPRTLLSFEDLVLSLPEEDDPPDEFHFPLLFTWSLPPLPEGPDLLLLATELAGVGTADLPLEVSAIDSYPSVTDPSERSLTIVARVEVSLARLFSGQEQLCDILDRCADVSHHLLHHAPAWLGEDLSEDAGVQAHEFSFDIDATPEEVWASLHPRLRPPADGGPIVIEHGEVRIEIVDPGDDDGQGLVRRCWFRVPRYLLSGGTGHSFEIVVESRRNEFSRYEAVGRPLWSKATGWHRLDDLGDGTTRVTFGETYDAFNPVWRRLLERRVHRFISKDNDRLIRTAVEQGVAARRVRAAGS